MISVISCDFRKRCTRFQIFQTLRGVTIHWTWYGDFFAEGGFSRLLIYCVMVSPITTSSFVEAGKNKFIH